ncbi:MAG: HlyD family efflux transporter periplasmic adaptor subunit [Oscillospiraceae bacterium]|nr:HlyD family efflux transporter periplasmic adaptor subunit [Oscillospiraceae bacterium]
MHLETKEKVSRPWVKNAAIIFLSVMLVLTFFSKTIRNLSLTEVSGQYIQAGTISTAVTGTGAVSANVAYHVQLDATRTIQEVLISVGDEIEAGQTLFILEETENTELAEAEQTLSDLLYNYNLLLIQNVDASYASENQNIQSIREDLANALTAQSQAEDLEAAYTAAKTAAEQAQSLVDELNNTIADLEGEITLATARDSVLAELNAQLTEAQKEQSEAEAALTACQTQTAAAQAAVTISLSAAAEALTQAQQTLESLELELSYLQEDYQALLSDADTDEATLTEALRAVERQQLAVSNQQTAVAEAQSQYDTAAAQNEAVTAAQEAEATAQTVLEEKTAQVTALENAIEEREAELTTDLQLQLTTAQTELASAQARLSQAQSELSVASSNYTTTVTAANANVISLQQSLEAALAALSEQQQADSVSSQVADLELAQAKEALDAQEALVEALTEAGVMTEVTAQYAGTVSEVDVIAGDIVAAGQTLASVNVEGKEYSLTISVTEEQAQKVSVGDVATVTNYVYGDIEAVLSSIQSDPDNPGKYKLLEFAVSGDVVDGQSLSISIGTTSESYDAVIPKSAVHEDSNGTYIYVASAKTTPLGTRYVVSRVAVIVEASDTVNAAVTLDGTDSDYVITTSAAPITEGEQVRLASE